MPLVTRGVNRSGVALATTAMDTLDFSAMAPSFLLVPLVNVSRTLRGEGDGMGV